VLLYVTNGAPEGVSACSRAAGYRMRNLRGTGGV